MMYARRLAGVRKSAPSASSPHKPDRRSGRLRARLTRFLPVLALLPGALSPFAAGLGPAAVAGLAVPAFAQDGTTPTCPNPTPTAVAVTAVPIVVTSTAAEYFVLYARHDLNADTTVEIPVSVTRGAAGTTTLSENIEALPAARYRVEKYQVADPADVDGDCIDDLTELDDPTGNPVNPAKAPASGDGTVVIPDRPTFEAFASWNTLKFVVVDLDTERPGVYFMNTNKHQAHESFLRALGIDEGPGVVAGSMSYYPDLRASDGSAGVYLVYFNLSFRRAAHAYTLLAANMPLLDDDLGLLISNAHLPVLQADLPSARASRIFLVFEKDIIPRFPFQALNPGVGLGRLRALDADERPHPRDIVLYEALPNELPRVAGIISTVPQTPLSHVNLRAVQNRIPNAFIRNAADHATITALLDSYVRYEVTDDGWTLRAATPAEVDKHYESARPAQTQTPQRDLSVTTITPLSEVGFTDWTAFGVKAANVAVLGTLGFPAGTVPTGFAIPFYFYNRFMTETALGQETVLGKRSAPAAEKITLAADTKLAAAVTQMLAHPHFQAGLYASYTQKPDETVDEGIDKSLKQVFASLWTFRAFTEREFHRIAHRQTAMGVLVHPNYTDEVVNGVAVSFNPTLSGSEGYYVNSQVGEDLVTNPEAHSVPEELLLFLDGRYWDYRVLALSNLAEPGKLLMSTAQLRQLRRHLKAIHDHFKGLYKPAAGEPFAMEIEFKITSANQLAIKQARPWVFATARTEPPGQPNRPPVFNEGSQTTRRIAENTPSGQPIGPPVCHRPGGRLADLRPDRQRRRGVRHRPNHWPVADTGSAGLREAEPLRGPRVGQRQHGRRRHSRPDHRRRGHRGHHRHRCR